MASATVSREDRFPVGTSVSAYPLSNWAMAALPPSGAPAGASAATAVVAATGKVTFTGLTDGVDYVAYALVSGEHRYIRFRASKYKAVTEGGLANVDRDNGQAGMYAVSSPGWFWQGVALVANRGYLSRFVPSRDMTIASLAIAVSVASSLDDAVDVGIYDANLNRLASSGAVTGKLNSLNTKSVALSAPVTLKAGTVYYAALSVGAIGGTAATLAGGGFSALQFAKLFGAAAPAAEVDSKAAMHPLPAAWGALGNVSSQFVVLALLEA